MLPRPYYYYILQSMYQLVTMWKVGLGPKLIWSQAAQIIIDLLFKECKGGCPFPLLHEQLGHKM